MSHCLSCGKELQETEGVAIAIVGDSITYEYCDKCFKNRGQKPRDYPMTRRIKVKGHYRVVTWDSKGHIVSSKKWSSKKILNGNRKTEKK